MKLYKAIVTYSYTVPVVYAAEEATEATALDAARSEVEGGAYDGQEELRLQATAQLHSLDELPPGWDAELVPYGAGEVYEPGKIYPASPTTAELLEQLQKEED